MIDYGIRLDMFRLEKINSFGRDSRLPPLFVLIFYKITSATNYFTRRLSKKIEKINLEGIKDEEKWMEVRKAILSILKLQFPPWGIYPDDTGKRK